MWPAAPSFTRARSHVFTIWQLWLAEFLVVWTGYMRCCDLKLFSLCKLVLLCVMEALGCVPTSAFVLQNWGVCLSLCVSSVMHTTGGYQSLHTVHGLLFCVRWTAHAAVQCQHSSVPYRAPSYSLRHCRTFHWHRQRYMGSDAQLPLMAADLYSYMASVGLGYLISMS